MAHRSKLMWWQCVENEGFGVVTRNWIIYNGPPDDDKSEIFHDLPEEEYRPYIKGLPKFKAGEVYTGRMAFIPGRKRRTKAEMEADAKSDDSED